MKIVLVHVPFLTQIRQTLRGHEKLRDAERGSLRSPRCHGDRCLSLVENSNGVSLGCWCFFFPEMMVSKVNYPKNGYISGSWHFNSAVFFVLNYCLMCFLVGGAGWVENDGHMLKWSSNSWSTVNCIQGSPFTSPSGMFFLAKPSGGQRAWDERSSPAMPCPFSYPWLMVQGWLVVYVFCNARRGSHSPLSSSANMAHCCCCCWWWWWWWWWLSIRSWVSVWFYPQVISWIGPKFCCQRFGLTFKSGFLPQCQVTLVPTGLMACTFWRWRPCPCLGPLGGATKAARRWWIAAAKLAAGGGQQTPWWRCREDRWMLELWVESLKETIFFGEIYGILWNHPI